MTDTTQRQQDVMLAILAAEIKWESRAMRGNVWRGVTASQVRDSIYPADSPMRTKRTHVRTAGGRCGAIGATGNMAAGKILAALERKGLVEQSERNGSRFILTFKGEELAMQIAKQKEA